MKAPLYDQSGAKKGEVTLPSEIFEIEASEGLIHQYLVYQQANERSAIAHVMNKADVSGGGRKPFRQKGTGNARQGSIRNPHYRGGGRAFGPKKTRNYEIMMPKASRRKALFGLLSLKAKEGKILAIEKFEPKEAKTKLFVGLIQKLPVERNVLIVSSRDETVLRLSARNMKNGKTLISGYLNPADLMNHEHLLFTEQALEDIKATYIKA